MRVALTISGAAHVALVVAGVIVLPRTAPEPVTVAPPPVTYFVDIGDEVNAVPSAARATSAPASPPPPRTVPRAAPRPVSRPAAQARAPEPEPAPAPPPKRQSPPKPAPPEVAAEPVPQAAPAQTAAPQSAQAPVSTPSEEAADTAAPAKPAPVADDEAQPAVADQPAQNKPVAEPVAQPEPEPVILPEPEKAVVEPIEEPDETEPRIPATPPAVVARPAEADEASQAQTAEAAPDDPFADFSAALGRSKTSARAPREITAAPMNQGDPAASGARMSDASRPLRLADSRGTGEAGDGVEASLTESELDALRSQLKPCWAPPAGAPNAKDLIVVLRVRLNPDGSVYGQPEVAGTALPLADRFMRTAVDRAVRAVLSCAPYVLPAERYDLWRTVDLEFDPGLLLKP